MEPLLPATDKYLTADDECMFMKLYCCEGITFEVEESDIALQELAFEIIPNPANSSSVDLILPDLNMNATLWLLVYDAQGAIVAERSVEKGEQRFSIDVSGLSSGVYFVNIRSEKGTYGRKLIIQR